MKTKFTFFVAVLIAIAFSVSATPVGSKDHSPPGICKVTSTYDITISENTFNLEMIQPAAVTECNYAGITINKPTSITGTIKELSYGYGKNYFKNSRWRLCNKNTSYTSYRRSRDGLSYSLATSYKI